MVLNRFFECLVLRPPDLYCSSCSHACRLLGGVAGVWWLYGFGVEFILIAGGMFCRGWGGHGAVWRGRGALISALAWVLAAVAGLGASL